jgi:hypothetical protein
VPQTETSVTRSLIAAVAAAALLLFAAAGCGTGSDDAINVPRLQEQLTRVVFQDKLAQGFDYPRIQVTCASPSADGLTFTCHVNAFPNGHPVNSWDEAVTCEPPQHADTPRCTTASGYALQ